MAFEAPLTAESENSNAIGGLPEMNRAATVACEMNANRSDVTIIR